MHSSLDHQCLKVCSNPTNRRLDSSQDKWCKKSGSLKLVWFILWGTWNVCVKRFLKVFCMGQSGGPTEICSYVCSMLPVLNQFSDWIEFFKSVFLYSCFFSDLWDIWLQINKGLFYIPQCKVLRTFWHQNFGTSVEKISNGTQPCCDDWQDDNTKISFWITKERRI